MSLFNKLLSTDHAKTPAGLERKILRFLPLAFLFGSMLVSLPALIVRLISFYSTASLDQKLVSTVDIFCIAVMLVFWLGLVMVGTGAFLVMLMKGPAYVADPYYMNDPDFPAKSHDTGDSDLLNAKDPSSE